MSKAIKTLAIATVIAASSSVAFAQSPPPYSGATARTIPVHRPSRSHHTAMLLRPIATTTVPIPATVGIPIPAFGRNCVATSTEQWMALPNDLIGRPWSWKR